MKLVVDTIPHDQAKSAFSNLRNTRGKLWNLQSEHPERVHELQERVDEVEFLLDALFLGVLTRSEWDRIQEIVSEWDAVDASDV